MRTLEVFLLIIATINAARDRPSIVLFLTDDQDLLLDSMNSVRNVIELIANQGITFRNAFVNTPICCPSRSTLLAGKFQHNTGVYNNSLKGNCSSRAWQASHEPFTVSSILHASNYSTFYAGKYLNEYGNTKCGGIRHVPEGYDWWLGLKGNSRYYNYTLSVNGTAKRFTNEYLTDVMKSYGLSFLNQNRIKEQPFFMVLSTPAPHAPFTPAPRHAREFPTMRALRTPSFNFTSNNKHWLVRMPPSSLPSDVTVLDNMQRHRFQTLLAVDEMVEGIMAKLEAIGVLDDTYVLYTSDNGFHIGQFVQPWDKRQPYETDIRVPLLIRGPKIRAKRVTELPVSFVDLAPTILDMAGAEIPPDMDGKSFLKDITDRADERSGWDRIKNILIEYHGEGNQNHIDPGCPWHYDGNLTECTRDNWCKCEDARNNTYACVRRLSPNGSTNFKFCRFDDNEDFIEAYDLRTDPYELTNVHGNMAEQDIEEYRLTLSYLQNCKGRNCLL